MIESLHSGDSICSIHTPMGKFCPAEKFDTLPYSLISFCRPYKGDKVATQCPKCQSENTDTAKFCSECAAPLQPSKDIGITKTLETPVEEFTRGTLFAERYEIIEELGKGGMGKVYRVEDKKLAEEVALKLIKPEISADKKTIERFGNELKIARKIRHKNVCGMYDMGEDKGTHFITMELVSGEDLKSLVRRVKFDTRTTIKIAKQVCEGLSEAHRLGVIHRDLIIPYMIAEIFTRGYLKLFLQDSRSQIQIPQSFILSYLACKL